jgi:hypothetical protein
MLCKVAKGNPSLLSTGLVPYLCLSFLGTTHKAKKTVLVTQTVHQSEHMTEHHQAELHDASVYE